jgi:hypothetical protein
MYGLGADQFLEFKVVTPDGKLQVANKVVNSDLFWALRGGGGSTFGVVVEATLKAHPDIPITIVSWELNVTDPKSEGVWDAYTELHRHLADFSSKKMSGYYYHYGNRLTGAFLHKGTGAGKDKAQAIWDPVLAKMLSFGGLIKSNYGVVEHDSFVSYFNSRFGKIGEKKETPWDQAAKNTKKSDAKLVRRHGPGEHDKEPVASAITNLDSRLLGAVELASKDLKAALMASFPTGLEPRQTLLQGHLVGGGKVCSPPSLLSRGDMLRLTKIKVANPDDDTSVLPAWRTALTHMIGYKVAGQTSVDGLRKLAPNSGAYANEVRFFLPPSFSQDLTGACRPSRSKKTGSNPSGGQTTRACRRSRPSGTRTCCCGPRRASMQTCTRRARAACASGSRPTQRAQRRFPTMLIMGGFWAGLTEMMGCGGEEGMERRKRGYFLNAFSRLDYRAAPRKRGHG